MKIQFIFIMFSLKSKPIKSSITDAMVIKLFVKTGELIKIILFNWFLNKIMVLIKLTSRQRFISEIKQCTINNKDYFQQISANVHSTMFDIFFSNLRPPRNLIRALQTMPNSIISSRLILRESTKLIITPRYHFLWQ